MWDGDKSTLERMQKPVDDRVNWQLARDYVHESGPDPDDYDDELVLYLNHYFCVDNLRAETLYGERKGDNMVWRTRPNSSRRTSQPRTCSSCGSSTRCEPKTRLGSEGAKE